MEKLDLDFKYVYELCDILYGYAFIRTYWNSLYLESSQPKLGVSAPEWVG